MNNLKLRLIGLSLLVSLLIGCATVSSEAPPIPEYSSEFLQQLSGEIKALPPGSATFRVLNDCYLLREQVRRAR